MRAEPGSGPIRRRAHWPILGLLALLFLAGVAAAQTTAPTKPDSLTRASKDRLRGGWYPWDPYQYQDYSRGIPVLTGFDVEIERALAHTMGLEIILPQVTWNDHLAALVAGRADIAAGATESEARAAMPISRNPIGPRPTS